MRRSRDTFFFLYFTSHILITVLFDSQFLLPSWLYPSVLTNLLKTYCRTMRDPYLLQAPKWYEIFLFSEFFLQLPFFFVGAHAYRRGARQCPWIRLPSVVYATHACTSLMPILYDIMTHNFATLTDMGLSYEGPQTRAQRILLASFYCPYFFTPLILLADALFSSDYDNHIDVHPTRTIKKAD